MPYNLIATHIAIQDLDFDLSQFDRGLHKSLIDHHVQSKLNLKRPTRFKGTYPALVPGEPKTIIDFAVRSDTEKLLRYTIKKGSITVADFPLLVVQKIISNSERQKGPKLTRDIDDVRSCLMELKKKNSKVPYDEILRYQSTISVWFWRRLEEDRDENEFFMRLLCDIGFRDDVDHTGGTRRGS